MLVGASESMLPTEIKVTVRVMVVLSPSACAVYQDLRQNNVLIVKVVLVPVPDRDLNHVQVVNLTGARVQSQAQDLDRLQSRDLLRAHLLLLPKVQRTSLQLSLIHVVHRFQNLNKILFFLFVLIYVSLYVLIQPKYH